MPAAHLDGLRAQAEFREERTRVPFSLARYALDQEPGAAAARYWSDQALDETVAAIAEVIGTRLVERRGAPRSGLALPRHVPPSLFGPPGTFPPTAEEALLQHPVVVWALELRDREIARLRQALVHAVGAEAARDQILGAAGASRGPDFLRAPVSAAPPPWVNL